MHREKQNTHPIFIDEERYQHDRDHQIQITLQDLALSKQQHEKLSELYDDHFKGIYESALNLNEEKITEQEVHRRTTLELLCCKLGCVLIGSAPEPPGISFPTDYQHGIYLLEMVVNAPDPLPTQFLPHYKAEVIRLLYRIYSGMNKKILCDNEMRANELIEMLRKEGQIWKSHQDSVWWYIYSIEAEACYQFIINEMQYHPRANPSSTFPRRLRLTEKIATVACTATQWGKEQAYAWSQWGFNKVSAQGVRLFGCFGSLHHNAKKQDSDTSDPESGQLLQTKQSQKTYGAVKKLR